jgi:hypothetical protein
VIDHLRAAAAGDLGDDVMRERLARRELGDPDA